MAMVSSARGATDALAPYHLADYALVDREQTPTPPAGEPVIERGRWAVYALE